MAVEKRDDAQHILVIFIVAHRLGVSLKERHIFRLCKLFGEFVDVHRLVVLVHILVVERSFRHKVHDIILAVDTHHRAVHPRFILRHQRQVGERIVHQFGEQRIVENQVALNQQRVVGLQLLLRQCQRVDIVGFFVHGIVDVFYLQPLVFRAQIVHQFLPFVAHHNHHAREVQLRELVERTVDKRRTVHLHHALRVAFSVFAEAFAHAGGKNNGLHIS